MTGRDADLTFPECCTLCPYLRPVKASCTHDLRQSLIDEANSDRTCSVYAATKTDAMRDLSESLFSRRT